MIEIFILGFIQFFSFMYFSKYFDFIYFSNYSLLILNLIQLASIWSNLWYLKIAHWRRFLLPIYLLGFVFLSFVNSTSNIIFIIIVAIFQIVFIQVEIISIFNNNRQKINTFYSIELLGGVFGLLTWLLLSSTIGFKGYVSLTIILFNLYNFYRYNFKLNRNLAFIIGVSIFVLIGLSEPRSINFAYKRGATVNSNFKKILDFKWDPSGRVELIEFPNEKKFKLLAFERGPQSTLYQFDGDYNKIRENFKNSIVTHAWGIDVVLPHFLFDGLNAKSLLISSVGGQEIIAAKTFNAKEITAVDINFSAQKMVKEFDKNFTGNIYNGVNVINSDGRHFVRNSREKFDIIQLYSAQSTSFISSFGSLFQPSSLVTSEAIKDYDDHLTENGILHIALPRFLKLKATFEVLFGKDALLNKKNFFAIKRQGSVEELASIYYRKSGWIESDIKKIRSLLLADKKVNWKIILDPYESTEFNKENISTFQKNIKKYNLDILPSTDNWPFNKIILKYYEVIEFRLLLLFCMFLISTYILTFKKEKDLKYSPMFIAFFSGVSYSLSQSILILRSQKVLGLPANGLIFALVLMLIIGSFVSFISKKWKMNYSLISKFYIFSIVTTVLINYLSSEFLICFILLNILCGSFIFMSIFPDNADFLGKIFWYNGLGFLVGFSIYNLIFVGFGFNAMINFYAIVCILLLYFFNKKSASTTNKLQSYV